jgi:hypothetical protein
MPEGNTAIRLRLDLAAPISRIGARFFVLGIAEENLEWPLIPPAT